MLPAVEGGGWFDWGWGPSTRAIELLYLAMPGTPDLTFWSHDRNDPIRLPPINPVDTSPPLPLKEDGGGSPSKRVRHR